MKPDAPISLDAFLEAPHEVIGNYAPHTLVFAAGGTRRSAVLANVSVQSNEYAAWARQRMMQCFDLIFQHGVSHILTFAIVESQMQEVTAAYRERLIQWVDWGLAGPEAIKEYAEKGWRVRLIGTQSMPELASTAQRLIDHTPPDSQHTVWWHVVPSLESPWEWILATLNQHKVESRAELVRVMYGADIPPIELFLSFGKPFVSPALLPPPLMGKVQSYWRQKPGYELTETEFRTILYDFSVLRSTWQADKTGRAESIVANRTAWEMGPTLGLGMQLGPFWYPRPFALPPANADGKELD